MAEFCNDRYISRDEHKEIVAYYQKLVANLHCEVRILRKDSATRTEITEIQTTEAEVDMPDVDGSNVVRFNFRPRK